MRRIFALAAVVACSFALSGCPKINRNVVEPIPEERQCTPEEMKAAARISPEEYWQIQQERQIAMKTYLEETLAIYQKFGGATPEAREDLLALENKHQARMQEILTRHGLNSTADLMPDEPCRQQVLWDRQEYMQEHPELRDWFMSMSTEMRDIKDEIVKCSRPEAAAEGEGEPEGNCPCQGKP